MGMNASQSENAPTHPAQKSTRKECAGTFKGENFAVPHLSAVNDR